MAAFYLHIKSPESIFEYDFPSSFIDKQYEIAVLKIDGEIELKNKQKNKNNKMFVSCNLIGDSYINNKQSNIICKINNCSNSILYEPYNLLYHKMINRANTIILKLVDENNQIIVCNHCDLYLELHFKAIN